MKLSDKALRLIGLHLLERKDNKTHQEDSNTNRNGPASAADHAEKSPHSLNLRTRPTPRKAPVLRFPATRSRDES